MSKTMTAAAALAAAIACSAGPALAHDAPPPRSWVYSEENSHYRDLMTDLSEARRELRNDLRGADDAADAENARREYRREVADAHDDFAQEMAEKGFIVRRGRAYLDGE
ncbi:hypothetical protein D1610_07530 [Sphingomonas gilva]|uniref:DUF4148 domain-containing protein n=1 Tax=Sphingomonas gilva TaxID=2305907 RepID=A0A396RP72_9SPHN|nr:hypothetical protein [Sphingomonas gilva]RHW18310.1 hypothetical protein D1610_07530 [Sphingomonas gilva]